jgi:hypothetical protein
MFNNQVLISYFRYECIEEQLSTISDEQKD